MPGQKNLLFIYNTDSGALQTFKDFSSGKASPSGEGACNLTGITHSPVGMKKEWKRFCKDLDIPSRPLHRNEFLAEFGSRQHQTTFPVVLVQKGTELEIFISTDELNRCRDLNDLIILMKQRLLFE
ncbi:MAG: hypothetical protein ACYDDV_06975 [Methanoregula sp.]